MAEYLLTQNTTFTIVLIREPRDDPDYWEVRNFYLYRVHVNPRTTRCAPYERDLEMPPWNLENIDIYRTTEQKDGF